MYPPILVHLTAKILGNLRKLISDSNHPYTNKSNKTSGDKIPIEAKGNNGDRIDEDTCEVVNRNITGSIRSLHCHTFDTTNSKG